jgi:radical SAM protein with 4Fe4S-binding SPASM domain
MNPEVGSWVAISQEEFDLYQNNQLDELKMENLYMRCLALDDGGKMVELDFPKPAEYPNVVVVNLTTTCNLRCKYCFADCDSEGEFMQEDVMRALIKQMFDMPSPLIIFELQGGEPLCHLAGMKCFVELSEELKKNTDKKVQYRTVTNCTLIDDEFLELAKKYDIKICISVDGPGYMTNQVRINAEGQGVFEQIIAGVKRIKESGLEIDGAVCTLGKHNINYPREIVEFFDELKISFKPRPANVLGREIRSNTTTQPGQWAAAYKQMHQVSQGKQVENFAIHIHEENVYTPIRDYICLRYPCGAAREVISANPDGSIYPCDGFKGEQDFNIGNVLTSHIKDMLHQEWVEKIRDRTHQDIAQCSKCMFRAMCCSCCYSAYGAFGTIYREDPHCVDRKKIFLYLIEEWIRKNL